MNIGFMNRCVWKKVKEIGQGADGDLKWLSDLTLKLLQKRKESSLILYVHKHGNKVLAAKLGIDNSTLSRWMRGSRKVSKEKADDLYSATGGEVDWRE